MTQTERHVQPGTITELCNPSAKIILFELQLAANPFDNLKPEKGVEVHPPKNDIPIGGKRVQNCACPGMKISRKNRVVFRNRYTDILVRCLGPETDMGVCIAQGRIRIAQISMDHPGPGKFVAIQVSAFDSVRPDNLEEIVAMHERFQSLSVAIQVDDVNGDIPVGIDHRFVPRPHGTSKNLDSKEQTTTQSEILDNLARGAKSCVPVRNTKIFRLHLGIEILNLPLKTLTFHPDINQAAVR